MQRKIYKFHCYNCKLSHSSNTQYEIKCIQNTIKHIFCPTCKNWIPIGLTNLSPYRFKLVNRKGWSIIDEDYPGYKIVFQTNNKQYAQCLCALINNGYQISHVIDYDIHKLFEWYNYLNIKN